MSLAIDFLTDIRFPLQMNCNARYDSKWIHLVNQTFSDTAFPIIEKNPTCDRKVSVEPGAQKGRSVNFHVQLVVTMSLENWIGCEFQTRTVEMRPNGSNSCRISTILSTPKCD